MLISTLLMEKLRVIEVKCMPKVIQIGGGRSRMSSRDGEPPAVPAKAPWKMVPVVCP